MIHFQLNPAVPVVPFIRWVLANHLHLIPDSPACDLVTIFEQVLDSRKHTISPGSSAKTSNTISS